MGGKDTRISRRDLKNPWFQGFAFPGFPYCGPRRPFDDPGPAEVDHDVLIVLREGNVLILIRVTDVHENEGYVRIVDKQRAQVGGVLADALERHAVGTCVISAVKLDRKSRLVRLADAVVHSLFAEVDGPKVERIVERRTAHCELPFMGIDFSDEPINLATAFYSLAAQTCTPPSSSIST